MYRGYVLATADPGSTPGLVPLLRISPPLSLSYPVSFNSSANLLIKPYKFKKILE